MKQNYISTYKIEWISLWKCYIPIIDHHYHVYLWKEDENLNKLRKLILNNINCNWRAWFMINDENIILVYFTEKRLDDIAHETFHLVYNLLSRRWSTLNSGSEEMYAYLTWYVFKQINTIFLKDKNLKYELK